MSQSRSKFIQYVYFMSWEWNKTKAKKKEKQKRTLRREWSRKIWWHYACVLMIALQFNWRKLNQLFRKIISFHSRTVFFCSLCPCTFSREILNAFQCDRIEYQEIQKNWLRKLSRAPLIRLHKYALSCRQQLVITAFSLSLIIFIKYSKQQEGNLNVLI